jgi:hypothetical protein
MVLTELEKVSPSYAKFSLRSEKSGSILRASGLFCSFNSGPRLQFRKSR